MQTLTRVLGLAVLAMMLVGLRGDILAFDDDPCDDIVKQLDFAIQNCLEINRGWACYGNDDTKALPSEIRFYEPGHRQPLTTLKQIDTISDVGAALMYFSTIGKENPVTVILYGGAELSPAGTGFVLSMIDDRLICEEAPPAMVAFTESRAPGRITVNGVDIELRSAALVTLTNPDTMAIANIFGVVTASTSSALPREITQGWQLDVTGIRADSPALDGALKPSPYATSDVARFLEGALGPVYDPNIDDDSQILACGGQIAIGETKYGEIHAPGQECLYTFCANQGDVVTVRVDAASQSLDPYIDLRNPDLVMVKANNDRSMTDANSLICNQTVTPSNCNHTIVVRSNRNKSAGPFNLMLEGRTACDETPCFCKVITSRLNLRSGPGAQYGQITVLKQGTPLEPLDVTTHAPWFEVRVQKTGLQGWIMALPEYVDCEPCVFPRPAIDAMLTPATATIKQKCEGVPFTVQVNNLSKEELTLTSLMVDAGSGFSPLSCNSPAVNMPAHLALHQSLNCSFSEQLCGADGSTVDVNVVAIAENSKRAQSQPASDSARVTFEYTPEPPTPTPTMPALPVHPKPTRCPKCGPFDGF